MKMNFLTLGAGALFCLFSSMSQAVVFTCEGVVTDVYAIDNNAFEVAYRDWRGRDMEPVIIYPQQSHFLGPALIAKQGGQQNEIYLLVLENKVSGDTRCSDGESDNALIGLYKKY
jgi:hypothetical protein